MPISGTAGTEPPAIENNMLTACTNTHLRCNSTQRVMMKGHGTSAEKQ